MANLLPVETGSFTGTVGFLNAGSVEVQNGTVHFADYSQTGGQTYVSSGGSITSGMLLDIQGGLVTGDGTVSTLNNRSVVQPGNPIGSLQVVGVYAQKPTGQITIEIGVSNFDQLVVIGNVTLAGQLSVSLVGGYTLVLNDQFTIVDNDGTDSINDAFSNVPGGAPGSLPEGATFFIDTTEFQISYMGGSDNNDVVLTVISTGGAAQASAPASATAFAAAEDVVSKIPQVNVWSSQPPSVFDSGRTEREQVFTEVIRHDTRFFPRDGLKMPQIDNAPLDGRESVWRDLYRAGESADRNSAEKFDRRLLYYEELDLVFELIGCE